MKDIAPVSVIIPCYRCVDSIGRAVDSVLGQSLLPAELLLVEDCSDDESQTLAVLLSLCSRGKGGIPIQVIESVANGGPAAARNLGWEAASQPYVTFLDADDAWHPQKLEIQYRWMESHPHVVMCGHLIAVQHDNSFCHLKAESVHARSPSRTAWLLSCCFSTISVMLRRDIPFRFTSEKRYAEDYLLWLQIVLSGYEVWRIETVLAYCYKPLYGAGGITAELWLSEKGVLDTYARIYKGNLISFSEYVLLLPYSLLKFLRRVLLVSITRFRRSIG